jgi:hypothetical protein
LKCCQIDGFIRLGIILGDGANQIKYTSNNSKIGSRQKVKAEYFEVYAILNGS